MDQFLYNCEYLDVTDVQRISNVAHGWAVAIMLFFVLDDDIQYTLRRRDQVELALVIFLVRCELWYRDHACSLLNGL